LHAGFADRLRTATAALHAAAERAGIMRALLGGRLGQGAYCGLLRNLYEIYAALETALDRHAAHPRLVPLMLPGLARRMALAADLRALHGERWPVEIGTAAATARYVERLRELEASRPGLLVAHAYVRYLGDLSGGQILRRIVAESLRLERGNGTAFYDFGDEAGALAERFRAGLDAIGPAEPEAGDILAEAERAFALHITLFDELAAAPSPGTVHSSPA
jgi:heme oxygenase